MIIATENSEGLWFEIYSNNQTPGTENMCVINTGNQKKSPYEQTNSNYFKYKATSDFNSNLRMYSLSINHPSALRIGDLDADTYPDLLVTLYDPSKTKPTPRSYLLKNQECAQEFCKQSAHKRYFAYAEESFNSMLAQTNNSLFATFMDIGEMG